MSKPITSDSSELLDRPVREVSREELAQLFLSAAKPKNQWFLGLEIELFPFKHSDHRPADHPLVARVLERLKTATGWQPEHEKNGALVGLKGGGSLVSLEPGGQLEYASAPHRALKTLRKELLEYCSKLRQAGREEQVGFWALGLQPFVDRDSAPKMPKARYDRMRAFLATSGTRGLDMMHLTGSVQCAVDFTSEQNMADKIRVASRISPFITALAAASPFSNGKLNGMQSMRYQIWLDTDDERCGIWPEMVDAEGLTPRRYLERAFRTKPMFVVRDGRYLAAGNEPFSYYAEHGFEGTTITVRDLLDHLTSFFPEVRPKSYVELRGADNMTPTRAIGLAGFWRGVLDDDDARREADQRLGKLSWAELRALQPAVAKLGLRAESPVGKVAEIAAWLVELSYARLARDMSDCAECVIPFLEMARAERSPADELIEAAQKTGSIERALDLCLI